MNVMTTPNTHFNHPLPEMYLVRCFDCRLHIGETAFQMDLWLPSVLTAPRYTLSVVDLHKRKAKNGPFAVFIVPQGRLVCAR